MAKAQHGYPLIFEFDKLYLQDALASVIREAAVYKSFTSSGLEAKHFVPRLDKLEIGARAGGGVALKATFQVASGRLSSGGQDLKSYVLECWLAARVSGTKIELEIDAGNLTMTPPGSPVPGALAKNLGLVGSLTLDLGGVSIGPWVLTPSEAALRCDGARVFVGVLLDIRDGATPFASIPQKDEQAFQAYQGSLQKNDWGYLVDLGLVEVFLDKYKRDQESVASQYDSTEKSLKDLHWTKVEMDGPKLKVTGECKGHYPTSIGDYHAVTFEADVELVVEDSRLKARWKVTRATGPLGINILPHLPGSVKDGELNTGFPVQFGSKQSDLGQLTAGKVGGTGNTFFLYGDGTAEPCDNATAKIEPPAPPIYIKTGESVSLIVSNLAAATGRKRAPLRIFHPRLENAGAGIKLSAKEQVQVAPGKASAADDIKVEYSGSGRTRAELVVPNNDKEAVIPVEAYEVEGQVKVAPSQITLTAYDSSKGLAGGPIGVTYNPTATVTVSHVGECPVRCRLALNDPLNVLSHDGPKGGVVLDKGQALMVRIVFHAIGRTATQTFHASLEVYSSSGNYAVGITARIVHPVGYIPGWKQQQLETIRHLSELQAMQAEIETLVKLLGKSSLPFPLPPGPRVPWLKVKCADLPQGTSLSLGIDGSPRFEGQSSEEGALLLAPILDSGQFELSLDAAGDAQIGLSFERWDVAFLGEGDVEMPVKGLAWKQDHLYVAGPNGLHVYQAYRSGKLRLIATPPSAGELVDAHFVDNWLMLARPGELLVAIAPHPQEVEVVGAFPLDSDGAVPLAASMDGRLFLAQYGSIQVYDGGSLPEFALIDMVEDPAQGRELLSLGSYLLSLGDGGLCIFDTRPLVPEMIEHQPLGSVTNVLPLGESLVVKTEGNGLVVLDLGLTAPAIVGRIDVELSEDDPLRCSSFLRLGRDGLLAGRGEYEHRLRLYQLVQYGVDEDFFAYYAAEHLESIP